MNRWTPQQRDASLRRVRRITAGTAALGMLAATGLVVVLDEGSAAAAAAKRAHHAAPRPLAAPQQAPLTPPAGSLDQAQPVDPFQNQVTAPRVSSGGS
jgi:hypothetical protein